MTSPTQSETIPDEIWEAARSLRSAVIWQSNGSVEIIARFLNAERKRAAEIVIAANNGSNKWREVAFSILSNNGEGSRTNHQSRPAPILPADATAGAELPPSAPASHSLAKRIA